MRKLTSKEDQERKRRKNQITAGIILVVVMVMSTLGFALQGALGNSSDNTDSSTQVKYNGFEFTKNNGVWILGNFVFQYGPQEVSPLEGIFNDASLYQQKPVYIYSEDSAARIEAYVNLANIAERIQDACTEGASCNENVPVKDCTDNFIIIEEDNSASVSQVQNCVYIKGPADELVKLTDGFLYKILGVN